MSSVPLLGCATAPLTSKKDLRYDFGPTLSLTRCVCCRVVTLHRGCRENCFIFCKVCYSEHLASCASCRAAVETGWGASTFQSAPETPRPPPSPPPQFFDATEGAIRRRFSSFGTLPQRGGEYSDPFEARVRNPGFEKLKAVACVISLLAPLRLFLVILVLLFAYFFAFLATVGLKCSQSEEAKSSPRPLSTLRRWIAMPVRLAFRMTLWLLGFYWVSVRGRPDSAGRVFIMNHVALWDAFYIVYRYGAAPAATADVFSIPVVGTIMRSLQMLPVQRSSAQGREYAQTQMVQRVQDERMPPLLVFPQAVPARPEVVTCFKPGAFALGAPVQPVSVRYNTCCDWGYDPTLGLNVSYVNALLYALVQPWNSMSLEFVPLEDAREGESHQEFAERVRQDVYYKRFGFIPTPHSFEDARLRRAVGRATRSSTTWGSDGAGVALLSADIFDAFHVPISRVEELAGVFSGLDRRRLGELELGDLEFAYNNSLLWKSCGGARPVQHIFVLVNTSKQGRLQFHEFVSFWLTIETALEPVLREDSELDEACEERRRGLLKLSFEVARGAATTGEEAPTVAAKDFEAFAAATSQAGLPSGSRLREVRRLMGKRPSWDFVAFAEALGPFVENTLRQCLLSLLLPPLRSQARDASAEPPVAASV